MRIPWICGEYETETEELIGYKTGNRYVIGRFNDGFGVDTQTMLRIAYKAMTDNVSVRSVFAVIGDSVDRWNEYKHTIECDVHADDFYYMEDIRHVRSLFVARYLTKWPEEYRISAISRALNTRGSEVFGIDDVSKHIATGGNQKLLIYEIQDKINKLPNRPVTKALGFCSISNELTFFMRDMRDNKKLPSIMFDYGLDTIVWGNSVTSDVFERIDGIYKNWKALPDVTKYHVVLTAVTGDPVLVYSMKYNKLPIDDEDLLALYKAYILIWCTK